MSTSSRRPRTLLDYLTEHGFLPLREEAWFDRVSADLVIRVVCEQGEDTQLIVLAPRSVCLYKAVFSAGAPLGVVTAAIEAALTLSKPRQGRPR